MTVTALHVYGDPGGWTHAGDTLLTVSQGLGSELDSAHSAAGPGLASSWYGPVSDAYQETWGHRYQHYGDALDQIGRAGTAIKAFGSALADLQYRAVSLEKHYLGLGLHLTEDGTRFMLPAGHESLVAELKAALTSWWHESESDVEAMWRDIGTAVSEVVTVLESVADLLEDYGLVEIGVIGFSIAETWNAALKLRAVTRSDDWSGVLHDLTDPEKDARALIEQKLRSGSEKLKVVSEKIGAAADNDERQIAHVAQVGEDHTGRLLDRAQATVKEHTAQLVDKVQTTAEDGAGRVASGAARGADWAGDRGLSLADHLDDVSRFGDVLAVAGAVLTVGQTVIDVGQHGLDEGVEQNLGDLAALGAGIAVGAVATVVIGTALPELLVGAAIGYVVSYGVGKIVQKTADDHKQGTYQVINDVAAAAPYVLPVAGGVL